MNSGSIQLIGVIVTGVVGLISIAAIVVAPIVALKLQKASDDKRSLHERQLQLFHTLMRYRATPLAVPFVQALNSIDLEFRSSGARDQGVRDAWTSLLDHFSNDDKNAPDFSTKSQELIIRLLSVMGKGLGFDFNEVYLKRHSYYPLGHESMELEQNEVRHLLLNLLRGHGKLPIAVFEERFPDLPGPPKEHITEVKHAL
jgi:hypothetical protein